MVNSQNLRLLYMVSSNPDTLPDIFKKLSCSYLFEIVRNPHISLFLIANPHFLPQLTIKFRRLLVESVHTPIDLLKLLSEDDSMYVRIGVACNQNTPTNIYSGLQVYKGQ
ncbi:hypothetical protein H1P_460001 [Hyella patelloides LEGE 07179]|uniref:Uncharacterized protein n=1 Tax=Hyella patelloides LEGE 07179 TaxID=945734 RepID=A0A563VYQ2_9CYAN|nr:hypothetical protein H1P_460001 [Hyella patelloides LEGE 07179]